MEELSMTEDAYRSRSRDNPATAGAPRNLQEMKVSSLLATYRAFPPHQGYGEWVTHVSVLDLEVPPTNSRFCLGFVWIAIRCLQSNL
jgi:hypothetical protein